MSTGHDNKDDGTRAAAVEELGEDAVREIEVGVAKAIASRLNAAAAAGEPAAPFDESLDERRAPEAGMSNGVDLSVRARARFEQATNLSGGRIVVGQAERDPSGAVVLRVAASPRGAAAAVTLTRHPGGEVALQLVRPDHPVAGTDVQAAAELGVEVEAWARSRNALEAGLAGVAGASGRTVRHRVATNLEMYREVAKLSRQDPAASMLLGVAGNDPAAQRERLTQAVAVRESWHAAADAAYAEAVAWSRLEDPDVPMPFGLYSVIRAGGDLEQALSDPEVHWQVAERLGINGGLTWVHDEDGQREVYSPGYADTPEGRQEIGDELARIATQVGVAAPGEPPSPSGRTSEQVSAADQERMTTAAQRVSSARPALFPPEVRPLRPEERSATSTPGRTAPGPGVPF